MKIHMKILDGFLTIKEHSPQWTKNIQKHHNEEEIEHIFYLKIKGVIPRHYTQIIMRKC